MSHRGPDARNKEVQPIRGSKRAEGSGREGAMNGIKKKSITWETHQL